MQVGLTSLPQFLYFSMVTVIASASEGCGEDKMNESVCSARPVPAHSKHSPTLCVHDVLTHRELGAPLLGDEDKDEHFSVWRAPEASLEDKDGIREKLHSHNAA